MVYLPVKAASEVGKASYRTRIVMVYRHKLEQLVADRFWLSYKNCYGLSQIQKWICSTRLAVIVQELLWFIIRH